VSPENQLLLKGISIMFYQIGAKVPSVDGDCFVAPDAAVVGDVRLGKAVSIWHGAVLRADISHIEIGEGSNIQDLALIHVDHDTPTRVGVGVSIGHHAALHGCTVGDYTMIGINAVVLNGAKIGRHCFIGANSMVPEGMVVPDGSLVMGNPARVMMPLDADRKAGLEKMAQAYRENGQYFARNERPCEPIQRSTACHS
jgi:carbonic anhydrase/acetyltransferase-like protein (isoleucine patch superfamily)